MCLGLYYLLPQRYRNRCRRHGHAFGQVPVLNPQGRPDGALGGWAGVRLHPRGRRDVAGAGAQARGTRRPCARREAEGLPRPDQSDLMRLVDTSGSVEWLTSSTLGATLAGELPQREQRLVPISTTAKISSRSTGAMADRTRVQATEVAVAYRPVGSTPTSFSLCCATTSARISWNLPRGLARRGLHPLTLGGAEDDAAGAAHRGSRPTFAG